LNTQPTKVITIEDVNETLKAWLHLLLRYKINCLFFFLAGGLSGFLYAHYFKKIVFKSRVTFVIDKTSTETAEASLLHYSGINVSGNPSPKLLNGDNMRLILQSDYLLKEALISPCSTLQGKNLLSLLWKENDVRLRGFSGDSLIKKTIKSLQKNDLLVGKLEDMGSFYFIEMNHENELFCFHFPQKLLESLLKFYDNEKMNKLNMDLLVLHNQTVGLKKEINDIRSKWYVIKSQSRNLVHFEDEIMSENVKSEIDQLESKLKINQELIDIVTFQQLRKTSFIKLIDKPFFPLEYKSKNRMKYAIIIGILYAIIAFIFYLNKSKTK
jgi:hypothetical protein